MGATIYPAFEAALASGDKAALLRLYDSAREQLARAEALNHGYELALSVRAQEREAVERALISAGKVLASPSPSKKPASQKPKPAPSSADVPI